jgi:Zn-dependent M28 family amino/carboxypeptidase
VIPLPGTTLSFHIDQQTIGTDSAPNVIGVVEGSDPTLKSEYVIYSGHMDHIGTPGSGQGCTAQGADSICNGADDDGSGSVAVLELAEAWATSPVKPKRSMAFILVSGEERGLWGSAYWSEHPTLPIPSVVADLNIDMVGRNAPDTVAVIGREHSDLSATLDKVNAAHPEVGLKAVGDLWPAEGLYFRSDHFNFARKGIPILFFTSGLHEDYHAVTDSPDKLDADKDARIAQLLYHLGETIANTPTRPQWDPASRARIVEGAATP